ncbi:MAG: hypothetical protein ACOC7K_01520 [bacterium]
MLTKPLFSWLPKLGTVLLAGYIAWLAWDKLGPQKADIGPLRMEAADKAVFAIVEDLRQNRGGVGSVVMLDFGGDPSGYFSDRLRSVIEQRGVLDLLDRSWAEKVRDLANLRRPGITTPAQGVDVAKDRGAAGVLYGGLLQFESTPGEALLEVEYTLADVASGKAIYTGHYSNVSSTSELLPAQVTTLVRSIPWFKRGLGWLVIVLLLPVFTIGFIRMMVARHSNAVNAFLLAIYTTADAILAYLLVGAALFDFWPVLFFVVAVAAAVVYNVRIMSFAVRLEEG